LTTIDVSKSTNTLAVTSVPSLEGNASRTRRLLRLIGEVWQDKASFFGLLVVSLVVLTAIFAPLIAPYSQTQQSLVNRLTPPFWYHAGSTDHLLGTDNLGRDILSRIIFGSRISLIVGISVVVVSLVIGSIVGIISGYAGGRVDSILMRIVDTQAAFPGLLMALLILAVIGPSTKTVILVLCIDGWLIYARVSRSIVLSVRELSYVEAAEITGCRPRRVMLRHIAPNLRSPVLTLAVLEFARIILAEATLSYLGLGVQPPSTSWGLMVSEGQDYVFTNWWLVTFPGLAIAATVLGVNLFASWLRVAADPQEREKRFAASAAAPVASEVPVASELSVGATMSVVTFPKSDLPIPVKASLLEVDHLQVEFVLRRGIVKAVRDISFSINPGETVGLVGESGSGKSVTAMALLGLVKLPGRIAGGDVRWKGRTLLGDEGASYARSVRGKELAIVFQDPMTSLNPTMTVGTQITEVMRQHLGMTKVQATSRAIELLDLVGISLPKRRIGQYPHEFSGGMRQRALIAMALACEPSLLIADEPTTALDVTIQAQILDLIADIQSKLGLAVLLITHDLGVVAGLCHRVEVMYAGKIIERGHVDNVFADPKHPYTTGLLKSTPGLEDVNERLVGIPGTPPDLINPPLGCPFAPRCSLVELRCETQPQPLRILQAGHPSREVACWKCR
jgi:peptide/nickel transport system permease protein